MPAPAPAAVRDGPWWAGSSTTTSPAAVTVVAVTYLVLSVAWASLVIQALISARSCSRRAAALSTRVHAGASRPRSRRRGPTGGRRRDSVRGRHRLLRMHPRGWLLGMVAAVIVLAVQLVSWYGGTPNYTLMAIAVAVVLLMNQAEVRDAFDEEGRRERRMQRIRRAAASPVAIAGESATDAQADLALLRRYEPIVHYTKGELFFPTEVDSYVARSSLWAHRPSTGRKSSSCPREALGRQPGRAPHDRVRCGRVPPAGGGRRPGDAGTCPPRGIRAGPARERSGSTPEPAGWRGSATCPA